MRPTIRTAGLPLVAAGLLALTFACAAGCNGAHLYNPAEHELAQKAESSFRAAKLSESVAAERELMAKMLERELDVVRRHVLARRDLTLVDLLQNRSNGDFLAEVNGRIVELAVSRSTAEVPDPAAAAEPLLDAVLAVDRAEETRRIEEARYRINYRTLAPGAGEPDLSKPPTAETLPGVNAGALPGLQFSFKQMDKWRREHQRLLDTILSHPDGAFGEVAARLNELEESRRSVEREAATLAAEYRQAKSRLDAETERPGEDDLKALAESLREKLAALETLGGRADDAQEILRKANLDGLNLAGLVESLRERQAAVQELLDAVVDEDGQAQPDASPSAARRLRVAAALPSVYRDLTAGDRFPKVGVLVLESNRLRLELEAAERRMATSRRMMELLRLKRDHMGRELALLAMCRLDLKDAAPGDSFFSTIADDGADEASRRGRLRATAAILNYGNAWSVHRVAEEQVTYMMIGARHAASLDASETALAHWQNLIGEPVTQLVALHGTGLRSEDVANIINAIGLGSIAYGVNDD